MSMNGQMIYMGEAAGYVVRLEDGMVLYFAGDTSLFGDMRFIGEMHHPDIAFLPIGDRFTMDPVSGGEGLRTARRAPGRADALGHVSTADRHARRFQKAGRAQRRAGSGAEAGRDIRMKKVACSGFGETSNVNTNQEESTEKCERRLLDRDRPLQRSGRRLIVIVEAARSRCVEVACRSALAWLQKADIVDRRTRGVFGMRI